MPPAPRSVATLRPLAEVLRKRRDSGGCAGAPFPLCSNVTNALNPQGIVQSGCLSFQPCRPPGVDRKDSHLLTLLQSPVVRYVRTVRHVSWFSGDPKIGVGGVPGTRDCPKSVGLPGTPESGGIQGLGGGVVESLGWSPPNTQGQGK